MKKYVFAGMFALVSTLALSAVALAAITPPPATYPTDKDQCKKGGWENFAGLFKNQGDCVSYVVTDGRNEPSGL